MLYVVLGSLQYVDNLLAFTLVAFLSFSLAVVQKFVQTCCGVFNVENDCFNIDKFITYFISA